jgi:hypothetical protein
MMSVRVECCKYLATGLPLPYAYEPILAETLFSQMLRLPLPPLNTLFYGTVMVDLIKVHASHQGSSQVLLCSTSFPYQVPSTVLTY